MTSSDVFEGIASVAQLGMVFAVGLGVAIAYWQLKATREAVSNTRRAQLAEEMIVLAGRVEDAFRHMRNPFGSIPQDRLRDKKFIYEKRYERVSESNELFASLRETQIRMDAVLGYDATKDYVIELFNARSNIAMAIEELIDIEASGNSERYADAWKNAHLVLYGRWSEKDEFGQKLLKATRRIREIASPFASWQPRK
ncbi:hypothetical protein [Roseovarius gaetbuli]|uniref:hypothetical protein n=1 Tax=Roseovarius gaetbuli TaxID=1356575 RepID=UPI00111C4111|nr:hypothetical protein [Roseovarius gaetbuli]